MARILIVEDETSIRKFLKISLKRENFDVIEAATGEDGIKKAREESPDVVILDIMLPGIDGFKVCEILKKEYEELGIIMLTARGQDTDRIMGLEFGADHYLVKPFNPLELIAIINSLLRRIKYSKKSHDDNYLHSNNFKIDLYSKKIYKNDKEIDLTPKEYMLMKIFMENPNKAFSRDELLDMVWGYNYIGENKIIDVNIRRIRSKIEDNPSEPKFIETIWGTGYRWKEN
ncbi:MAG: response regulator transcription factor [Clostridium argentinense]|uniref:Stage 0 sporulation protein A homolog n=1 Tax=Clostridium faecium TaxID=2762223 RepID=A0ABR8YP46_9CLOT|nr:MULTISPECIES: response regulator transcription factor [Clostridium]MBD8045912.1 response regulator transcription factor [Clostridium faecium]MBS5822551.1 response regulator transcription factor [Clostridium argentinense]MDU1347990.1 response regulator transcription factor [Clostridium argentinense]